MINHLYIKNVALIERVDVDFLPGLNIISGETGAGKSMLIDAVNFVLGERPGKDFIRSGEETAQVDAILTVGNGGIIQNLAGMGVETDEECRLFISRSINHTGKSVCKINGRMVTVGMLKDVSSLLADIHGQHAHQSLLNVSGHIISLDQFCGGRMEDLKRQLAERIKHYKYILSEIRALSGDENERSAKASLLKFQCDEIEAARLSDGEEERLSARLKKLSHLERLLNSAFEALALLNDQSGEQAPALEQTAKALHFVADMGDIDENLAHLAENIASAMAQLSDVVRDLRQYAENLEHDPKEQSDIEVRLDLIHTLKKKYGRSVAEILAYGKTARTQLEIIENSHEQLSGLKQRKKNCTLDILALCEDMSKLRKAHAADVTAQIVSVLRELGMKDALFDVAITRKKEFGFNGFDAVEFLISPNAGEPLKPLAKIASGGEMSRVMLALKTVLVDADQIETFIFDEIDAGVSGRTAQKVAEKLSLIAKKRQVLCITHLPQIAAMGDAHFLIDKNSNENRTATTVTALNEDGSIQEIARLIGGAVITDATVKAAGELRQMAVSFKT